MSDEVDYNFRIAQSKKQTNKKNKEKPQNHSLIFAAVYFLVVVAKMMFSETQSHSRSKCTKYCCPMRKIHIRWQFLKLVVGSNGQNTVCLHFLCVAQCVDLYLPLSLLPHTSDTTHSLNLSDSKWTFTCCQICRESWPEDRVSRRWTVDEKW